MSYTIYYSDPAKFNYPITVPDNTIYSGVGTGGLTLVGRNYPAYGQVVASDLIRILENSASPVPPANPIEGQLWYDNSTKKLRFNNGAATNANWKPINGLYQQEIEPTDAVIGDVWVDTSSMLVRIHDGTQFILFGNQVDGVTDTGAIPDVLYDIDGNPHQVILNKSNGVVVSIISGDTDFTNNSQLITGAGFSTIQQGVNLNSSLSAIFNGTAEVANYISSSLGNIPGNDLLKNNASQTLNGQLTITQDGNALRIGTDPTFTLSRTVNGSYATFYNTYRNYGSFNFVIKNSDYGDVEVLNIGGTPESVRIPVTTPSISTTTGALQVSGGAGIAGNVFLGGSLTFTKASSTLTVGTLILTASTTASSTQTGSLVVAGGAGVAGSLYVGGDFSITKKLYDAFATGGTDGQVLVSKGGYVKWQTFTPATTSDGNFLGNVWIQGATESTTPDNGALLVTAGAGIGGNLNVGGNVTIDDAKTFTLGNTVISSVSAAIAGTVSMPNTSASTSTTTGALVIAGGVGVGGNLYVGGTISARQLTIQNTTITYVSTVIDDVTTITNTTNAINTNSGALRVVGGVAVGKDLRVGGAGYFTGTVYTNGVPLVTQQSYVINTATNVRIGGVKYVNGASILVDSTGVIAVNTSTLMNTSTWARYVSTPASDVQLGGVFAGVLNSNIDVDGSGVISVPIATDTNLGVVSIPASTLSGLENNAGIVTLSTATAVYIGGVRIGANISVTSNGTISVATPYSLPLASLTTLGGVKIGNGIFVSSSGTISVNTLTTVFVATTSTLGGITVNPDFPSIVVDPTTGEIGLNVNFLSQGLTLTKVWDIVNRRYDFTYILNTASNSVLGGVKIGNGFSVDVDGTINVTTASYTLNTATSTSVGGIKIGTGIDISADGTISVNTGTPYVLTSATAVALGGVKIGNGIDIDGNGVISVYTGTSYVLSTATAVAVGGVRIGSNVSIDSNGTISVAAPYVLTTATAGAVGGVRIGTGVSIDGNGIISLNTSTLVAISVLAQSATTATSAATAYSLATTATTYVGRAVLADTATTATSAATAYSLANTATTFVGIAALATTATTAQFVSTTATGTQLGGVKIGANMAGATDGTITFNTSTLVSTATTARFVSTTATSAQLGGIKLGSFLTASGDGTVSVNTSTFAYTLPVATASVLGGVKIGANINVAGDGTISITPGAYTLSTATAIALGGVKIGSGITITGDGTISVPSSTPYTLPVASSTVLGGVKPATSGFNIDGTGVLTINTGTLYANFASSATYATYVTFIGSTSTIGGVRQVFDFPSVLIDQTYGDLSVNINFTSTNGLTASYAWNAGTSKWDATFNINTSTSNTFWVNNNTNATSTSTGALKVAGGTGVGGNAYIGGNLNIAGVSTFTGIVTISSGIAALTTSSASALHVEGGISLGSGVVAGKGFYSTGTFAGTFSDGMVDDYVTGMGRISVGAADGVTFYRDGVGATAIMAIDSTGTVTISTSSQASSTQSGALRVTGGAGIGGNFFVGGYSVLQSISTTTVSTLGTGTPTGATVYFTNITPRKIGVYNGTAWTDAVGTVLI